MFQLYLDVWQFPRRKLITITMHSIMFYLFQDVRAFLTGGLNTITIWMAKGLDEPVVCQANLICFMYELEAPCFHAICCTCCAAKRKPLHRTQHIWKYPPRLQTHLKKRASFKNPSEHLARNLPVGKSNSICWQIQTHLTLSRSPINSIWLPIGFAERLGVYFLIM